MKNKLLYTATVLACLATVSCEKEFKLKGLDALPKACVEFLPSGEDSSLIKVFRAHSTQALISNNVLNSFVDDPAAAVSIEVNGVPVDAVNDSRSLAYVHRKFIPGEEIRVKIDLGDGCVAESRTIIPPAIEEYEFRIKDLDLIFDYKASMFPEYLAIVPDYIVTTIKSADDETRTFVQHGGQVMHFKSEYKSDLTGDMVAGFESVRYGDRRLYFWKDADTKKLENGWHRMSFPIYGGCFFDSEYDQIEIQSEYNEELGSIEVKETNWHIKTSVENEFQIYGIHEDLYHYLCNQIDISNNDYGRAGLAPTIFNWTNVRNGFGIVAGMSYVSTGWFKIPD